MSESLGVLGPGTKGTWGACQWLSGYLGARLQHIMGPFLGLENFSGPSLTLICSLIFPFLHVSFNKWVLWTSHPPGLWLQFFLQDSSHTLNPLPPPTSSRP